MKVFIVIYSDDFEGAKIFGVYYKIEDAEEAKRICEYYCNIVEVEIQ